MTYEDILSRFTVKQRSGSRAQCLCPAHADKEASLTVTKADDGRTLIYCHANCPSANVLQAVGLKFADLYGDQDQPERWRQYVENRQRKQIDAIYDYCDLSGQYAFTRIRFVGKDFAYGILEADRFTFGLKGKSRKTIPAIFTKGFKRLQDAPKNGERIYYAEGEKDVLALIQHGYIAVTCGGSSDWVPACAEVFRNADAVIVGDNDQPGRKLVAEVTMDLMRVAKSVRVVYPVTDQEHGDISDFFTKGHTIEEFERLVNDAEFRKQNSENTVPEERHDLDRFHLINEKGKVTGVFDLAIFRFISSENNLFVMGDTPYFYCDGVYRADSNGAILKTKIRDLIYPEFVRSTTIRRIYDLFIGAAELQVTFDQVNDYPSRWICFKNAYFDPLERKLIPHDKKYRTINQIPHVFNPEEKQVGQAVEDWLRFIVPDPADREMLLQYSGYCLTRDCHQQKFLILCGEGGSGKSTLIRLFEAAVGSENTSNISLSELTQRFSSFGLMGKLLNSCADLEIGALEDTSLLKKALGEDTLRGEQKGHDAVSFRNYARLVFSTNEFPLVKAERTNGFYRRLLVLTMNRVPEKERVDLFEDLKKEIDYFIQISVDAVGRMYHAKRIAESPSSVEAVKRLRCESDTVEAFLQEEAVTGTGFRTERTILYNHYDRYCYQAGRQALSRFNFYKVLKTRGFTERSSNGKRFIQCISLEKSTLKSALPIEVDIPEEDLPFG